MKNLPLHEPFTEEEIEENLPTMAVLMAIGMNQGTDSATHLRMCDILQVELEIGLRSVPSDDDRDAIATALRAVETHRRAFGGGPKLEDADVDSFLENIENFLKERSDNDREP